MKIFRLLVLMLLTLAITLGTFTSCDVLEQYSDKLPEFVQDLINKETEEEKKEEEKKEEEKKEEEKEPTKEELWQAQYSTITIAEALTLCEDFVSSPSTDRYYIIATVKSVDDTRYGKLMIEDETGEIMVYGTNSADGSLKYDAAGIELKAGDVILIYGTLQNYSGNTKEVQNAWLIDYYTPEGGAEETPLDVKSGDTITIEKALSIANKVTLEDYFYITATVKSVTNATYGEMVLVDETGEIPVYNTKNLDGTDYAAMEDKPYKGDTVTVKAHINVHNGTAQIKQAYIVEFTHATLNVNPDDYALTTIRDARLLADDAIVKVQGVVARITYADGMIPSGFYLIDSTSSIYVYDGDLAARVAIGNTVTVIGAKDHWILATEQNNADKYGYKGCNQITSCVLVDNDKGNASPDFSWVSETSVKQIIDTPFTEDITTLVYKVTALIRKVPGSGFVNYYIDDLDGVTGTYTYTQCSGSDFAWLDQYDGKICTVYLSALNAKSTQTGCNWRFIPVAVIDEGFTFDVSNAPEYAVNYHGATAFESSYMTGAKVELPTTVDSELLGFSGANLAYAVSDTTIANVIEENGKLYFVTYKAGTVQVTIAGSYTGVAGYEKTITITVEAAQDDIEYLTISEAIAVEDNTEVIVKGIVGPSAINQKGTFYLIDDGASIPVQGFNATEFMAGLQIGHEVIIKGTKTTTKDGGGQILIDDAVIIVNYYGEHKYSTESFIKGLSASEIKAVTDSAEATLNVYVVTATVKKTSVQQGSYTNVTFYVGDVQLYSGSASQYSWLEAFFADGQSSAELTVELALCDWNAKGLKGCVLAVYNADGTKTCNTFNFN